MCYCIFNQHKTSVLIATWITSNSISSPGVSSRAQVSTQGSHPFSETSFQDFSKTFPELRSIFQGSKIHINPYTHKISMLILLTVFLHFIFLVEFNRFPELSRTSGLFPGLSSPGKCHSKIPGLSRFSRTRTNPVNKFFLTVFKILPCHEVILAA